MLESRKDVVGQSEKKKSKRVRVNAVEGKRKCVIEDEVNLGVKPKKSKVQKAEKVKIPDKVCKTGQRVRTSLLVSSTSQGISLKIFLLQLKRLRSLSHQKRCRVSNLLIMTVSCRS
nr:uncharacterized protein LOC117281681 [Nicotiana tomentosiformis]